MKETKNTLPDFNASKYIFGEKKFQKILDSLQEGIQIISFDWRYQYLNQSVCIHQDSPKSSFLGHTIMKKYPGIELTEFFKTLEKCMNKREPQHLEHEFLSSDGSSRWLDLNIDPVEEGISIRSIDITAYKLSEDKTNKAAHLYAFISQVNQNIVRAKNEPILFHNACKIALKFGKFKMAWIGKFDPVNKRIILLDQSGIPEDKILMFLDILHENDGPQDYVLQNNTYYICNDIERELQLQNWKPFAVKYGIRSCMIIPIKKNGAIFGTFNLYSEEVNFLEKEEISLLTEATADISFALDIFEKTKRHDEMEELLIQNEKRYRALIEKSKDMITLVSSDSKLIYCSPSIKTILGYSIDELLHKRDYEFIHPDDISDFQNKIKEIKENPGQSFSNQQRLFHKNGHWIWCEGTVTNMLNEPGINAIVSNFRDISKKRLKEEEKEKMVADIIQHSKNLEQFAYIISHNLRGPIANILGIANVLKGDISKADRNKSQSFLFEAVENLDEVIKDLVKILQTRSEITERKELIYLQDLVDIIMSSIHNLIEKENVQMITDFSEVDSVLSLKSYLHSIFYNLIANSIKYRQSGRPPIIYIKSSKHEGKIIISIKDNGIGIDLEQYGDKIFGLYHRFHQSVEGKGLGLFMTKTQVEVLRGQINVRSELGEGTEFNIELPQ